MGLSFYEEAAKVFCSASNLGRAFAFERVVRKASGNDDFYFLEYAVANGLSSGRVFASHVSTQWSLDDETEISSNRRVFGEESLIAGVPTKSVLEIKGTALKVPMKPKFGSRYYELLGAYSFLLGFKNDFFSNIDRLYYEGDTHHDIYRFLRLANKDAVKFLQHDVRNHEEIVNAVANAMLSIQAISKEMQGEEARQFREVWVKRVFGAILSYIPIEYGFVKIP